MTQSAEASTDLQRAAPQPWRRALARSQRLVPFAAGAVATLLGLVLYSALTSPPQQITLDQVNIAVAEAMASATPAPAYSALVYRAVQPSLVLIQVSGSDADEEDYGLGSGVVISERGDILTALHVVEGAGQVTVTFADGTKTQAQIASSQPEIDIAVLQPDEIPELVLPAVMGNPNALRVGDEAYAVGNPFGLYGSMSSGVISGFDRAFKAEDSDRPIEGLIQVDTAVNPGNSGGPLLNRYGQVVGIVVGVLNPTDQKFFVGIGFAVPITIAASGAGAPNY
jgi:S1-C subfamily serine protease